MKRLAFISALLLCLYSLGVDASTNWVNRLYAPRLWVNRGPVFYVSDYGSIANTMTNTFPTGAVVDGGNQVYYERLVVPTNDITIRNLTVDGTVSMDTDYSFSGSTYGHYYSWSLALNSTEIWKKRCDVTLYWSSQDGSPLAPRVCADQAAVTNNLQRGEFTFADDDSAVYCMWVRCTDGANVNTHALRGTRRDWDSVAGIIYAVGKTNLTFNNVGIQNYMPNNSVDSGAFYLTNTTGVTVNSCFVTNTDTQGILLGHARNMTVQNSRIVANVDTGIVIEGNCTNVFILGNTITNNGRVKLFDHVNYSYRADGDNIGIGGIGGSLTNIVIGNNIIGYSGAPDYETNDYGSGIFAGTASSMTVDGIVITNNQFLNNHLYAVSLGVQTLSKTISGNMFEWNGRVVGVNAAHTLNVVHAANANTIISSNLFIYNENTNNAATLNIDNTITTGTMHLNGNAFYNNGGSGAFQGDISTAIGVNANFLEDYNSFYRVAPVWGTTTVINSYDLTHITNNVAGNWRFDKNRGLNDSVSTTGPLVNPTSFTP